MNNKINWYPGHMFKAKKEIISQLKIIDLVIEVIDARVPISSHNEMLDELTKNKEKLLIFSKTDLVNQNYLEKYMKYYQDKGYNTIAVSVNNTVDRKKLLRKIELLSLNIKEKFLKKGINKLPRILIMGMPNVGKSSIINFLVQRKKTNVGNKPGVTKAQQWINVENLCELLDTPGILIPKIEDINRAYKLVCCGLIKDEVVELEHVCVWLLEYLKTYYPKLLMQRYNITDITHDDVATIYEKIGASIGAIVRGECDYERVTSRVINDYRKQKFGELILDNNEIF